MNKALKLISLGIAAALGALVFEIVALFFIRGEIELDLSLKSILFFSYIAFIEEAAKFLVIYENSRETEGLAKSIKNAFFVGLGFSLSELTFKLLSFKDSVFQENFTAFIFHIVSSLILGLLLFRKRNPSRLYLISILVFMSLFHLLFNLFFVFLFLKDF